MNDTPDFPRADRPVTMITIAREAAVSVATVSLALKGNPRIPEKTRRRIALIADRLGYQKSAYIAAHMACRRKAKLPASSPVLAFLEPRHPPPGENPDASDRPDAYFEGAARRAAERGFRLERFPLSDPGTGAARLSSVLYVRNIAGAILAPLPDGWQTVRLEWRYFATVALGFTLRNPPLHRVASDPFQSMTAAVEKCRRLGYRRIGLTLTRPGDARVDGRWLAAYVMFQTGPEGRNLLPPFVTRQWNPLRLLSWLKKSRPDVLITPWANQFLDLLHKNGWNVPDEIGLVTVDMPAPNGPVGGVFQNRPLLGSRAVDTVIAALERNERGIPPFANTVLIDGIWRPGSTVRPEKAPAEPDGMRKHTEHSISMRELAERLNLHTSTVSLSLKNSPAIALATRKRVRRIAREMGYRANPFVSKLMKARRTGKLPAQRPSIAFITTFPTPDGWREKSEVFVQYFNGASEMAARKGFQLEEVWAPPHAAAEVSRKLRRRGILGILIPPLPAVGAPLRMRWEWFCTVGFGFTLHSPSIHRVDNDHYSSMRRAVRQCRRLGYRRIGLALNAKDSGKVQSRWLASYLMQQRELRGIVPVDPLIARRWTQSSIARWLDRTQPDVIIAFWPADIIHWLNALNYSVPRDIGVVGLRSPELGGPLSGTYERAELLGGRAAEIVISLVEQGKQGISEHPRTVLIDGIWNPGGTVVRQRKPIPAR